MHSLQLLYYIELKNRTPIDLELKSLKEKFSESQSKWLRKICSRSRNFPFIENCFSQFVSLIHENFPGKTEFYTKEAVRFLLIHLLIYLFITVSAAIIKMLLNYAIKFSEFLGLEIVVRKYILVESEFRKAFLSDSESKNLSMQFTS